MDHSKQACALPFGVLVETLGEILRGPRVMRDMLVALMKMQQVDSLHSHLSCFVALSDR
jgi:hypothetical protein